MSEMACFRQPSKMGTLNSVRLSKTVGVIVGTSVACLTSISLRFAYYLRGPLHRFWLLALDVPRLATPEAKSRFIVE